MSILRNALLQASQSRWLCERAPRFGFVRRTATRFLPGETPDDALEAVRRLAQGGIRAMVTYLGENVSDRAEAHTVTQEYARLLERIHAEKLPAEISVKLTQLGLDVDRDLCSSNVMELVERSRSAGSSNASNDKTVWIDMEHSQYVDATLEIYHRAHQAHKSVGVCVQAYLRRTERDVASLISRGAAVRLVKGAYNEPPSIAFPQKTDVDAHFFDLARMLLGAEARAAGVRTMIATHDRKLIARIAGWAASQSIARDRLEFAMLYGIQRAEQLRLAHEGYRSRVLVSYGSSWFPWFMRRLAERPANVVFLARNLFAK